MKERIFSKYARILNRFEYPDVYRPLVRHDYMLFYLCCIQNYANDRLKVQGHVSILEVYELLGLSTEHIINSADGWDYDHGDGYIDFGIYNIYNSTNRDFINGLGDIIVLDFNVD